jgi:hypothetical protein
MDVMETGRNGGHLNIMSVESVGIICIFEIVHEIYTR